MRLNAGHKLGPYEILAHAGAGGIGEVYRAHNPRTAGAPLQTTDINLNVTAAFASFHQTSTLGGVFRLTIPFNVAGTRNDIDSLTATLTNSVGPSQPVTVRLR
jgi:hypothetical protein